MINEEHEWFIGDKGNGWVLDNAIASGQGHRGSLGPSLIHLNYGPVMDG